MTFTRASRGLRFASTVLFLVALTALGACGLQRDIKEPQVVLENVRPVGGGVFSQQVELDLRITNPNDFALPFDGMRADLRVNDIPFAQGVSDTRITIPRLSSETVTLTATVSTFDLARQVFNAGRGARTFSYALDGTAYLGGGLARSQVGFQQSGGFQLAPDAEGSGTELRPSPQ